MNERNISLQLEGAVWVYVQLVDKVGRSNRYVLMFNGAEPYVDRVDESSVMFTDMRELLFKY